MAVDITPLQDGGVLKEILREGTDDETPMVGDKVSVHYVGTLTDGTQFDSSRDRNEYFVFDLGKGSVIKAWDIGVATMKRGELCRLTATPEYAYGANATGSIPADSTLIFEVELFDFKGEDISPKRDGMLIKRTLQKGETYTSPNEGATVKAHITGSYEGRVFEERDVEFVVGEACEKKVVEGIDIGIKKMKKDEKCQLTIGPKLAFGTKGSAEFGIPGDATVRYTVDLNDFEKVKDAWEMNPTEKIAQSNLAKSKGTEYFKAGRYRQAVKFYKRITDYLGSNDDEASEEQKSESKQLLLAAHLNLAMCYLKVQDNFTANEQCEKALESDPNNEKGLFRRGQARVALQNFDGSIADFEAVIKMDPNNKAARNQLANVHQQWKQYREKEKKKYLGMFDKMSKADTKMDEERRKNQPDMAQISEWDNKMADGMLSIEKEAEAFKDIEGSGDQINEADGITEGS